MALNNEGGMTLRQLIVELRKQYLIEPDVLDAPVFLYDSPAGENFTIRSVSITDEGEVAIEKGRPAWTDPTWNQS